MNKSKVLKVMAYLQVGMILQRKGSPQVTNSTNRVIVTAIGLTKFLCVPDPGTPGCAEYAIDVGEITQFEMDGWNPEWQKIGEQV